MITQDDYTDMDRVMVEDSSFTENTAGEGGAIMMLGTSFPQFRRCLISRNSATRGGGGLLFDHDFPRLEGCEVSWNRAPQGGGLLSRQYAGPTLVRCSLIANSSEEGGGVLSLSGSTSQLTNCLIAGNLARLGGGVMSRDSGSDQIIRLWVTNCTISANVGGGVSGDWYGFLLNSIVWGNRGGSVSSSGGRLHLYFSCLEPPAPSGPGCVHQDPLFLQPGFRDERGTVDPSDDLWRPGDYRLDRSSPAVEAGAENPVFVAGAAPLETPQDDLPGNPRPAWWRIDMGAFEYIGETPPGPEVSFVFVSRSLTEPGDAERLTAVTRAGQARLMIGDLHGRARPLLDAASPDMPEDAPRDVLDPDVSFDGKRILFSGYSPRDGAFRLYEVGAEGSGLRELTHSDRITDLSRYGDAAERFQDYDDLDPCYLPDGRICFVSTRYPGSAPAGRERATNLYLVNADGSGLRRITSERFGADTPAVDPTTGKIVFSRWWRTPELRAGSVINPEIPPEVPIQPPPYYGGGEIPRPSTFRAEVLEGIPDGEFPGVNSWFLSSVSPDGRDLAMFSGFHLDRIATLAYRPSLTAGGEALALFLTDAPRYGQPGRFGLRRYQRGPRFPVFLGGPQTFDSQDPAALHYQSAAALPDGRMLLSASPRAAEGTGSFDIYVQGDRPIRILGTSDMAEMDPVPLLERTLPPVIADQVAARIPETAPRTEDEARIEGGTFTFQVKNMFANAPVDVPIPNAPPAGEPLFIEFYMAPQRTSFLAADPPTLLRRLAIPPTGELEVELPAGVPLFEVLRRPDGTIPVGRDGQVFHVGGLNYGTPGTTATCVGCHAGHSMMEVPADPTRTNLAPAAAVTASSSRARGGVTFRPAVLVDRRTDFFRSEWAAADSDRKPWVRLGWKAPVQAREVVIYLPRTGGGVFGARSQAVRVTLNTFLSGAAQESRVYPNLVEQAGTRYLLDESRPFDTLEVVLGPFSGEYEGGSAAALAEIEVIGRMGGTAPAGAPFLRRGDIDGDGLVQVTDPIALIGGLFLGKPTLACEDAADADDDGRLNITDVVVLLGRLSLGGEPLPSPGSERCGEDPTADGLSCRSPGSCGS